MNEQTNEIICECGHPLYEHTTGGCLHIDVYCGCTFSKPAVARIQSLLSLVEGQAQTITQLREAIQNMLDNPFPSGRQLFSDSSNEKLYNNYSDARAAARALLASTAPKDGQS